MTSTTSLSSAMDNAISEILQSNFDADSKTCLVTLMKLLDNIFQQPDNPKVKSIRMANAAFTNKVVTKKGVNLLLVCGFTQQVVGLGQGEEHLVLPDLYYDDANQSPHINTLVLARQKLHQVAIQQLHVPGSELPAIQSPRRPIQPSQLTGAMGQGFNIYETQRYDGPSAAVGTNLSAPKGWKSQTHQELQALQKKQTSLESKLQKTLEREWIATSPATAVTATTTSATAPTTSDSALLASLVTKKQQERQAAENRGFTTKAMRDLEQLRQTKVYSHTQLAISFPDGCIVKGNFRPSETIAQVVASLQSQVFHSTELPDLDLYVTPPRTLLQGNQTLQKLQLVPAAKIHVSWKRTAPTNSNPGWYIRPELLASTAKPTLPQSQPVVSKSNKPAAKKAAEPKRKPKTKADKEASLLKRMMGGM